MAHLLLRGWVPHDEGAFGQSAVRVLAGELPHRDFDEIYTGGLAYLHALAFRTLGLNLASLRLVLFVCFLAWVPTVYLIASRFASGLGAAAITLLAAAWSVPNYAAAVPSWYNLFFATFGVAAAFRHLETNSRFWLFVAGLCGGLSFLAKTPGLYYVAGLVLFLIFRAQCLAHTGPKEPPVRARAYALFVTAGLLLLLAALCALVRRKLSIEVVIQFLIPVGALAALLMWREWRLLNRESRRLSLLLRMLLPFGLGFAIPVAVFLVPYAASGSLGLLYRGLFVLPMERLTYASLALSPLYAGAALLPLLAVLVVATRRRSVHWMFHVVVAVGVAALLALSRENEYAYGFVWHSLDLLIPLTVVLGAALVLFSKEDDPASVLHRQQVMLVLCVTALCNLVRFPFSAPIYFCYVAPLLALAALAVLSMLKYRSRFLLGPLLVLYLLFAVLWFTPSFIYVMGDSYEPDPQTERLSLPRAGGLRVDPDQAEEYEHLIPFIQQHAAGGFIYAAPDCPEVYFLSGLRNPTRTLLDFFDEPAGRKERILNAIDTHQVKVVAIFSKPNFSPQMAPDLTAALAQRFPYSTTIGRFEVRWRP